MMKEMLGRFGRANFPLNRSIIPHHGRTPKDFSLEFVLNRQATGPCPNVASVFREGVGWVGGFNGWFIGCTTLICPMTS